MGIYMYIIYFFCLGVGFEILNQRENDETKTDDFFLTSTDGWILDGL